MATGFYLLDHQCNQVQYRTPRRVRTPGKPTISGCVVVHVAESLMDTIDMDTGAENVAQFITIRTDYGSYHELVDSDSFVPMAPDDYETWQIAEDRHNWHSWGISAACKTTDWNPEHWWTIRTIDRMGARICAYWIRRGFDPVKLASKWLTKAEFDAQIPGLILHGEGQPSDRTDAWDRLPSGAQHPHKAKLKAMLTAAILRAAGATPGDEPMSAEELKLLRADIAALSTKVDKDHDDTRKWLGGFPMKTASKPDQFIVYDTPAGPVKHRVSGAEKDARKLAGQFRNFPPGFDFVTLTAADQIAWLDSLPTV